MCVCVYVCVFYLKAVKAYFLDQLLTVNYGILHGYRCMLTRDFPVLVCGLCSSHWDESRFNYVSLHYTVSEIC